MKSDKFIEAYNDVSLDERQKIKILDDIYNKNSDRMSNRNDRYTFFNMYRYALVAVFALCIIFGSASVYAMSEGISLTSLVTRIWYPSGGVDQFEDSSEMIDLKENNKFKNINIQLMKTVCDKYATYIVVKVTMADGSDVPEDMGFSGFKLYMDGEERGTAFNDMMLKHEKKECYLAFQVSDMDAYENAEASIKIEIFNSIFVKYGEDGIRMSARGYTDSKDGSMWHENVREDGRYTATMKCKVNTESIIMHLEDDLSAEITPLSVVFRCKTESKENTFKEIFSDTYNTHFELILTDGIKVKTQPMVGLASTVEYLENLEPVEVDKIDAIKIDDKQYDVK